MISILQFAEMFFTDIFTMWFNFTIDDDRFMPIELDVINTTVPLEIIFYKNGGLDNDGYVILGDVFSSELLLLDLTFTIEGNMPLEYFYFLIKEYIFTKNWISVSFIETPNITLSLNTLNLIKGCVNDTEGELSDLHAVRSLEFGGLSGRWTHIE